MGDDLSQNQTEDRLLGQAASEFLAAVSRGENPSVGDYAKRYPKIALLIKQALPAIAMLNDSETERDGHPADRLPKRLGDFQIIKQIGRGGMGVVYEAEQISIGRRVALKILPLTAMLDETRLERFQLEVRAAATLDHPHCVPIYAVGEDHGVHFYAMKLIPGQTLTKVIEELQKKDSQLGRSLEPASASSQQNGKQELARDNSQEEDITEVSQSDSLSVSRSFQTQSKGQQHFRQIAKLGIQAAEALHHAHERGIVHRDIKPSNLILDNSGSIWITDFGLARIEADAGLTMTGDFLGTLRYMSPEQALGKRALIDHRADIYSLGITLYELLALRPAVESGDRAKILRDFAESEPPSLSKLVPSIPIELETIIGKAIEKNPSDRYTTAEELAADLGRYLRHEPILAKRSTQVERTIKWVQRHPTAASLIAVTLIAVISVAGLSLRHASELKQSLEAVVQNQSLMKHYVYMADINLAYRAWEDNDLRACENMLLKHLPENEEAPPGIEWRLLWRLSHPPVTTIDKIDSALYAMTISPQGDIYAVAGEESVVRLYDTNDDRLIDQFPTEQIEINSVDFSPDGLHLATAGDDGTVKIWDCSDHSLLTEFRSYTEKAYGAKYFPDGKSMLVWGTSPKIYRWDLEEVKQIGAYEGNNTQIESVALSSDGNLVFTADNSSGENPRKMITLSTQDLVQINSVDLGSRSNCIVYAPKRKIVFTGTSFGVVAGWKVGEEEPFFQIDIADSIQCLAIDSKEKNVAFGDLDGVIRVCNIDDPSKVMVIPSHDSHVQAIFFDPKGHRLISCGRDGQIKNCIYDSLNSRYSYIVKDIVSSNLVVVGESQVAAFERGAIGNCRLHMLNTNHLENITWDFPLSDFGPLQSPSGIGRTGRYLATFSGGGRLDSQRRNPEAYLLDEKTGELVRRWPLAEGPRSIAVSDVASLLAAASSKHKVQLFDTESGKQLHEFSFPYNKSNTDPKPEICFSPNGQILAYAIKDEIHLFDVKTKERIRTLRGHARGINAISFNRSGSHVACAGIIGRNIRIWKVATGKQTAELTGHLHPVLNVQFLTEGRLFSNDKNGFAVWDLTSQQQYYYHSVGKLPHDIFEGVERVPGITDDKHGAVQCAAAVILPKEDWLALTPDLGSPQFLKLDVSDVWPKR